MAKARKQQLCLETIDVSLLLQEVSLMDLVTSFFKTKNQVFFTLMQHQVKLDATFLSLVIAVAVVEVL